jgi:hypothetical protein
MRIVFWVNKPTNTHCYFLLNAFSRQQWLRERAYVLPSTYIVRFVTFGPMTANSLILTLVIRQRTRSVRAERDATFRTLHFQLRHIVR